MLGAKEIQYIVDPTVVPTPEQTAIIEAPLTPLLVVAGAGSGKTETMAMRVLWVVANHEDIPPRSVLGLTFTKKAAGELGERLRTRVNKLQNALGIFDPNDEPVALTYNAFAQRILSEHGLRIGIDPDYRTLGEAGSVQLMTDILSTWPRALDPDLSISSAVSKARHLAGQLAEHGYNIDSARAALTEFGTYLEEAGQGNDAIRKAQLANARRIAFLDPIAHFIRRKREAGLLDFSDQLSLATRIVTESEEAVAQIRAEHRCVLLDEFQDTSVVQMEFLSRLFSDHPVTAVGDPNQAIYGWRGASASSLESFLARFCSAEIHEGQTLGLSTAWRNDRRILVAANAVAEPLRQSARAAKSPVLIESPRAHEGRVRFSYPQRDSEAIDAVVDYIDELRSSKAANPPSIAILSRKRKHFLPLDRALRDRGIPTQIIGLGGLLDQPAVSDLRAALEITHDVQASPSLLRLLIRADLGAADLGVLSRWARHLALESAHDAHAGLLLDAVDSPPPPGWSDNEDGPTFTESARRKVEILGDRLHVLRQMQGRGLVELAERAMRIMGILDDAIADPLGVGAREALDAFLAVIADYESTVDAPTLAGLLTYLDTAEQEERGLQGVGIDPDPHAVQILTVHAAKGLEWDAVVVYGLSDMDFPQHASRKSVDWLSQPPGSIGWVNDPQELPYPLRGDRADLPDFSMDLSQGRTPSAAFSKWLGSYKAELGAYAEREERRLAYVALTRAKHDELLVGAWIVGQTKPRFPSRYLMESRKALIEDCDGQLESGTVKWSNGRSQILDDSDREGVAKDRAGLNAAISARPEDEDIISEETTPVVFPVEPGPSRRLIARAAQRVREAGRELRSDADVFTALAELADSERVRDITALLRERRLRAAEQTMVIWEDRVPATSVSKMIDDPRSFARDLRRPIPQAPLAGASLGTLFHLWAERQLRQVSGELWDEPIVGLNTLSDEERDRFETMTKNFSELDIVRTGRPLALEEPFVLTLAGISVTGRIDAVFEDANGHTVIVDWKSGFGPSKRSDPHSLRSYVAQLRLYRSAWAQLHRLDEADIDARLVFVGSGRSMNLAEAEKRAGVEPSTSLETLLTQALSSQQTGADTRL